MIAIDTQLAMIAAPFLLLSAIWVFLDRRLARMNKRHTTWIKKFELRHKCFELVCDDRKLHSESRFYNGLIRWLHK